MRGIEERPQIPRPEWRIETQIRERLRQVRKTLVPGVARRDCDPQDCSGAAPEASHKRRMLPTFASENTRLLWNFKYRQINGLLPYNGQLWRAQILDAANRHSLLGCVKPKRQR